MRVIDLIAACTEYNSGEIVVALEARLDDTIEEFLGRTIGSNGLYKLFQPGDYVLVSTGGLGLPKTGFVEATRATGYGYEADIVYLDGSKGTANYNRMIWAQVPEPLKAFMDAKACVKKCPLKKQGACMEGGKGE